MALLAALLACGESFSGGPAAPQGGNTAAGGEAGSAAASALGGGGAGGEAGAGVGGHGTGGGIPVDWCLAPATPVTDTLCLLAADQDFPEFPVIDDTFVYWSSPTSIGRVRKSGEGGPQPEFIAEGTSNEGLVLYEGMLWWVDEGDSPYVEHPVTIWRYDTHAKILDSFVVLTVGPRMLAVAPTAVYWTSWDDALNVGAVSVLDPATGLTSLLVVLDVEPAGIAVDGETLYWIDTDGLHRLDLSGELSSLVSDLGGGIGSDSALVLDGTRAYWNVNDGIASATLSADDSVALPIISNFEDTTGLALHEGFLYFADNTQDPLGLVARVLTDGEDRLDLATGIEAPRGVAVEEGAVYFATSPDSESEPIGTIMKARLP